MYILEPQAKIVKQGMTLNKPENQPSLKSINQVKTPSYWMMVIQGDVIRFFFNLLSSPKEKSQESGRKCLLSGYPPSPIFSLEEIFDWCVVDW